MLIWRQSKWLSGDRAKIKVIDENKVPEKGGTEIFRWFFRLKM